MNAAILIGMSSCLMKLDDGMSKVYLIEQEAPVASLRLRDGKAMDFPVRNDYSSLMSVTHEITRPVSAALMSVTHQIATAVKAPTMTGTPSVGEVTFHYPLHPYERMPVVVTC